MHTHTHTRAYIYKLYIYMYLRMRFFYSVCSLRTGHRCYCFDLLGVHIAQAILIRCVPRELTRDPSETRTFMFFERFVTSRRDGVNLTTRRRVGAMFIIRVCHTRTRAGNGKRRRVTCRYHARRTHFFFFFSDTKI